MTRVFIFGWTLPLTWFFSEETEMWSHSDLIPADTPVTPAQCLCCIEGGRGKQHHFLPTWHKFFHSSAPSQSPLSLFLSLDAHTGPCIPCHSWADCVCIPRCFQTKGMGPFLQSPTQEPGHVAKASRGWCFHFFKWMCSCFTFSELSMQYVTVRY